MTVLKQPILVNLAVVFFNICINAVVATLLPRVSLLFFGDPIPGIVAGGGWILSVRLTPSWDASYTVAGLLLFCLFSASLVKKADRAWIAGAVSGLFAGSLFLLNTSSMLVSLPWIGYLLMGRPLRPKRMLAYCGALLAVFALFGAAWILRNDLQLGAPVLRTNLGMTLYASNNDCAQPSLIDEERQGCYGKHHPNEGASEAHLLGTFGEVKYDRKRIADARNWMITHRRRFVELTVQRYRDFWFPPTELHPFSAYLISIATAVSILGLVLMAWHRQRIILFVVPVLWLYPLMYYVVVSDIRYRYPVLWISLLAAGYAAHAISQFTRDRLLSSSSWAGE
jgi:hypothetical protein